MDFIDPVANHQTFINAAYGLSAFSIAAMIVALLVEQRRLLSAIHILRKEKR
jgi:heme exporter protein D